MEEGRGTSTADLSGLGFNGTLSAAGLWTKDTPTLPKVPNNRSALDLRGGSQYVNRSATGGDGIFVQATLRSFAYEIANIYANAEREGLDQ